MGKHFWQLMAEAGAGEQGKGGGGAGGGGGGGGGGDAAAVAAAAAAAAAAGKGSGGAWPEKWRDELAGGDAKVAERLQRFDSPNAIFQSYRALEQRVSSGELKAVTPFPKDGKPEDQSAWRKENGIPEAHDKYDTNLGNGLVIGENDKPLVEGFLKHAHASNFSQATVKDALGWYFQEVERQQGELATQDAAFKSETEEKLRGEWGQEYKGNVNRVVSMLDGAPAGLKDRIMSARMPDGRPLFSDPDALRWLVQIDRAVNPGATLVPGQGATQAQNINAEIARLEGLMKTDRSAYNKEEARYRQLLEAREKMKTRAAA